jgi:leader peptidase (prepilin peptidase) / N-methyltransferase
VTAASWAAMAAIVAGTAGWFLPALISRLPERTPDDPVTYRLVAGVPRLQWWLAVVAAATGAVLGWARAGQPDLVAFLVLGVLGTAMGYVDLRRHLLPDRLTVPALLAGAVLLAAAAVFPAAEASVSYPRAWAGAGGLFVFYLLLALAYPAGLGLGDVKLAAALGLHLGWLGWAALVVGTMAAFLVGGLVGIVLLVLGRATRRSPVPFGPSMLVGALVAIAWSEPIAAWYLR